MYKPRHRKQRDWSIPAGKTVAVGVAAAGIATAALATAPGAEAHPRTVWDGVAACDSGGNGPLNTGHGYNGGRQLAAGTRARTPGRSAARAPDSAGPVATRPPPRSRRTPGVWRIGTTRQRPATTATTTRTGTPTRARITTSAAT